MSRLIVASNRVADIEKAVQSGGLAIAIGDALQRVGQVVLHKHFAGPKRALVIMQKNFCRCRPARKACCRACQRVGDIVLDRKALPREPDRRL